jgi:acetyl esterase
VPLHPQAEQLLELQRTAGVPRLPGLELPAARALFARTVRLTGPGPAVASVRDVTIPVRGDVIGARIYRPTRHNGATIVYFHGGGWVLGNLETHDAVCRGIARASSAVVVSIDYRLAPEHRFPTAVDDVFAALRWVSATCDPRGGLVVAGDSAGGNLAAVCALRARDAGGPPIDLQVLVYPVTDHDLTRSSYVEHGASGYMLGLAEMEWFWSRYADPAQRGDAHASPLRAPQLAGLPPALIMLAEFDPLRDEGLAYAARLQREGASVEVVMFDDMFHGFFHLVNFMERADEAVDLLGIRVRELARTRASGHES